MVNLIKVAYLRWLQQKTVVEAEEVNEKANKNARRVIRQAQNEEWVELRKSLQDDFQKNQRRFWKRVRMSDINREEPEKYVLLMGILEHWREFFLDYCKGDSGGR